MERSGLLEKARKHCTLIGQFIEPSKENQIFTSLISFVNITSVDQSV